MHIKVSDILAGSVGENRDFEIVGERPELDDLELVGPLNGQVKVMKTDDGLMVSGTAETVLRLQCHRCLSAFEWPARVRFEGEFSSSPEPDQWQLGEEIDLAPLIRQELILAQPIKQICGPDCQGICDQCGLPAGDHQHEAIRHRPRITKAK